MRAGDLTNIATAKAYLGIDPGDVAADATIAQQVRAQSRRFCQETRRDILYKSYVEVRDGNGTFAIEPRQYPVVAVSSVLVDEVVVPPQPAYAAGDTPPYGWVVVSDRIQIVKWPYNLTALVPDFPALLYGNGNAEPFGFRRGNGNVQLAYTAGFRIAGESQVVPSTGSYSVQTVEPFVSDLGVTYANGTALTKVASGPVAGQYAVSPLGTYTFAAADAGAAVLLSYAHVPADIEQAVLEMVAWKFREKDHVGQRSKEVGAGNVVGFITDDLPPSAMSVIATYQRVQI